MSSRSSLHLENTLMPENSRAYVFEASLSEQDLFEMSPCSISDVLACFHYPASRYQTGLHESGGHFYHYTRVLEDVPAIFVMSVSKNRTTQRTRMSAPRARYHRHFVETECPDVFAHFYRHVRGTLFAIIDHFCSALRSTVQWQHYRSSCV